MRASVDVLVLARVVVVKLSQRVIDLHVVRSVSRVAKDLVVGTCWNDLNIHIIAPAALMKKETSNQAVNKNIYVAKKCTPEFLLLSKQHLIGFTIKLLWIHLQEQLKRKISL